MGTTITAGCVSRGSQNSRNTRLDHVTGEVHGPIVIGKSPRRSASDLGLSNPSTRRLQTHLNSLSYRKQKVVKTKKW